MAEEIQSNIRINIETKSALDNLKALQNQISAFQTSMSKASASTAAQAASMQQNLINSVNATGKFSAGITKIESTTERFTTALEKNKFSMREYFNYSMASTKSFGSKFASEFATIERVATERVKDLQTQYIKLGRDASGAMKAIKVRPLTLDMNDLATKTQLVAQKQQILNQLIDQGSTKLLNFGKNTQWAGRQLMVGFTIPLSMFAGQAIKSFQEIQQQVIDFQRVYGNFSTSRQETEKMSKSVLKLANSFTQYGVAVKDTMDMAATAAAAGKSGQALIDQVTNATKLSVLGGVSQQDALQTTISLTNAFNVSSKDLSGTINYLNAVENQTVLSISDLTDAIPKAAPVVKQLGGNIQDLTFFMTAMKEGGVTASQGANALKSALGSIINPSAAATKMLQGFGINITDIVNKDKGNLRQTVLDLASALDRLDPVNRARAIEQMFGKFQFSRISTLLKNVVDPNSQAATAAGIGGMTPGQLAQLSQREMEKISSSPMYQFKKAMQDFQTSIAPIGESFLKAVTPILKGVNGILKAFDNLPDGVKQGIVSFTSLVFGIGPVFIMTFGLIANGVANVIKGFNKLRNFMMNLGKSTNTLGEQTSYMTQEQIRASSVAASLDQIHQKLKQTFTQEASAVDVLRRAYEKNIAAQEAMGGMSVARKYATGGIISGPGTGTSDSIIARVSNGEAIIPAKSVARHPDLVNALVSGNIPGFAQGKGVSLYGGQSRAFAGNAMYLPGNTQAGFGFKKELLTGEDNSLISSRLLGSAIGGAFTLDKMAGIFPKFSRMTEKRVAEYQDTIEQYVPRIIEALKNTESEMATIGKDVSKIDFVVAEAEPKLRAIFSEMSVNGEKAASAALALSDHMFFPTDESRLLMGEHRGPAVRETSSGKLKNTWYRLKQSRFLSNVRAASNIIGPKVGPLDQWAHLNSSYSEGPVYPFSGGGMNPIIGEERQKALAEQLSSRVGFTVSEILSNGIQKTSQALKTAYDIHSPSKVEEEIAKERLAGTVKGAVESIPKMKIAGEQFGQALLDSTKLGFRMATGATLSDYLNKNSKRAIAEGLKNFDGYIARPIIHSMNGIKTEASLAAEALNAHKAAMATDTIATETDTLAQNIHAGSEIANVSGGSSKTGKISGLIGKYTGLSSSKKFGIGMGISAAMGIASMIPGPVGNVANQISPIVSGISMLLPVLGEFGGGLSAIIPFLGPIGIGLGALTAGFFAIKFGMDQYAKAQHEAYLKTNALNVVISNNKKEMSAIGKTFGFSASKSISQTISNANIAGKTVSAKDQSMVAQMINGTVKIEGKKVSEYYSDTIQAIKGMSNSDAQKALLEKQTNLIARGMDKRDAESLISAIKNLGGKGNINTNQPKSISDAIKNYSSGSSQTFNKSMEQLRKDYEERLKAFNKRNPNATSDFKSSVGLSSFGEYLKSTKIAGQNSDYEKAKGYFANYATSAATTLDTLFQSLKSGKISAKAFNSQLSSMAKEIDNITNKNDKMKILVNIMKQLNLNAGQISIVSALKDTNLQLKALDAMAAHPEKIEKILAMIAAITEARTSGDVAIAKKTLAELEAALQEWLKGGTGTNGSGDKLTALQKQLNLFSAAQSLLQVKEDKINKTYQDRINALEQVQKINSQILQQQKDQLGLATALSQGDIAGAAKAAQEMRANNAQASLDNQKQALQDAQTNAVANAKVKVNGKWYTGAQLNDIINKNTWNQTIVDNPGLAGNIYKATGGYISGPGTPTSDSIPAMLSNGEYVIRANAVKTIGVDILDRLNQADRMGYANGGSVDLGNSMSTVGQGTKVGKSLDIIKDYLSGNENISEILLSMIPGIGIPFNAIASYGAFKRGDIGNGILNGLGAIPGIGILAKIKSVAELRKLSEATHSVSELESISKLSKVRGLKDVAFANASEMEKLAGSGLKTIGTKPEDILQFAISRSRNPMNKLKLMAMLSNIKKGKVNNELLDKIAASSMYDDKLNITENASTKGMGELILALNGNSAAKALVKSKVSALTKLIKQNRLNELSKIGSYPAVAGNDVDMLNQLLVHSTKYGLSKDKNGILELMSGGSHAGSPAARPSVHFSIGDKVADHLSGNWAPEQDQIVSTLGSMIKHNGKPSNIASYDTWWTLSPKQKFKLPGAMVIKSFKNESEFDAAIKARGLTKTGTEILDAKNNEVLRLIQSDRNMDSAANYSALELAKKHLGADTRYSRHDGAHGISDNKYLSAERAFAIKNGITSTPHSGTPAQSLETRFLYNNFVGSTSSNRRADFLESLRTLMHKGILPNFISTNKNFWGDAFGDYGSRSLANGGMVKYFANGGFAKGTDIIPAMLTPGEFVVNAPAARKLGADKLSAINSKNTSTLSGDSVYNYTIEVNVSSNSDAKDIANMVLREIRRNDSQRIRSGF